MEHKKILLVWNGVHEIREGYVVDFSGQAVIYIDGERDKPEQPKIDFDLIRQANNRDLPEQPEVVWFLEHIAMSGTWLANSANLDWTKDPHKAKQFRTMFEAQEYDDNNTANGNELHCYPTEHIFVEQPEAESQRFIMPTDKQLIDFAIIFNEGKLEPEKLADMVGMCTLILDRLFENGKVDIPSSKEDNS
jgi:hypothetical protein